MSKKGKSNTSSQNSSPLVYSTNPDYMLPQEEESVITLAPADQLLRVILETKHRAGKTVTIVYGFEGALDVKDGEIIIQGDHRQKIFQYLKQKGYQKVKL